MTNDEFAEAAARARGSWSRRLATNSAQRLAVRQVIATMPKHLQGSAEAVAAELARLGPAAIGLALIPSAETIKGAIRDRAWLAARST